MKDCKREESYKIDMFGDEGNRGDEIEEMFDIEVDRVFLKKNYDEKQMRSMRLLNDEYKIAMTEIHVIRKKLGRQN